MKPGPQPESLEFAKASMLAFILVAMAIGSAIELDWLSAALWTMVVAVICLPAELDPAIWLKRRRK